MKNDKHRIYAYTRDRVWALLGPFNFAERWTSKMSGVSVTTLKVNCSTVISKEKLTLNKNQDFTFGFDNEYLILSEDIHVIFLFTFIIWVAS